MLGLVYLLANFYRVDQLFARFTVCSINLFLKVTAQGAPDEVVERMGAESIKLYNVSDESGTMTTTEVVPQDGEGLTADLLDVRNI